MIKANELRIGNFFHSEVETPYSHGPGWKSVYSIQQSGVNKWDDMGASGVCKYEEMYPIPLTREVLLKCGFKNPKGPGEEDVFAARIDGVYLQWYLRTGLMNIGGVGKPVKYLHQLQNRIFSLTETELFINL